MKERTFIMVEAQGEGFVAKVLKQTMEAVDEVYSLESIYGDTEVEQTGADCVICLEAAKDTMILPCRHLCLCHNCALHVNIEMNKCPICRYSITAIMNLRPIKFTS